MGVGHRDVKPGNVMFGFGGRVQLIDFGTAWDGEGAQGEGRHEGLAHKREEGVDVDNAEEEGKERQKGEEGREGGGVEGEEGKEEEEERASRGGEEDSGEYDGEENPGEMECSVGTG